MIKNTSEGFDQKKRRIFENCSCVQLNNYKLALQTTKKLTRILQKGLNQSEPNKLFVLTLQENTRENIRDCKSATY